ncbi:MAG TPA: aminotransferase class I/II-fold pyridoxal phosphate-dependent enzyme [Ktedonobacteraceae bacterium]|nr:aminotransferase class I/II-fold pyridoxal phosphate-dependent enzyme [Ktedonobacteraceae bacterium]
MTARHFPPFRLERWFAEFEFVSGMRNLAASGPFAVTTRELLELESAETTARYLNLGLDYIENPGSESLRRAIANLYTTLKAEDVQVTLGASEALLLLVWTMVKPGENIVVEDPCYENITGVAQALGLEVRRLPLRQEDDWKPDPEKLAQLIDRKTRLVYLIHPHNPTGSVLGREEMQTIAAMTERVGALLVNDEVFRLIALEGEPMPSIVDVVEQAVSIGDMSKPWGLGGLRVGWIASRQHELLQRISEARDYASMCCSAPGAFLAELALRHSAPVLTPRLATARANRDGLAQAIAYSQGTLSWQPPHAGYTCFVQLPIHLSSTKFCRHLAQEKRVLLVPGQVYGAAYEHFMRIGFGCTTQVFEEGLDVVMGEI